MISFSTFITFKLFINDALFFGEKNSLFISSLGDSGVLILNVLSPQGLYCLISLGPNRPTVGILSEAAKCIKPESFPINNLHFFKIEQTSINFGLPIKLIILSLLNDLQMKSPIYFSFFEPISINLQ